MKVSVCSAALWVALFIAVASPARGQESETYTIIPQPGGMRVCVGAWIPPTDIAQTGVCEGQLLDLSQFAEISARQTVEQLDQVAAILTAIDQKLAANNELMNRLIKTTAAAQAPPGQQTRGGDEALNEAIDRRFAALPEELLNNERFREELARMKKDILEEVEKRLSPKKEPARK
ncbi:MAG: hypothetical protein AB1805_13550 [Nitrospirota bacterium]